MAGPYVALRKALFSMDAERVHRLAMAGLRAWSDVCDVDQHGDMCRDPQLARTVFGVTFPNPLGLAAGFDKDAEAVPAWQALGFGFVEVGTVTRHPQPGNDKPRLFRLPADQALLNRLGFNNHGAEACARALSAWRAAGRVHVPVGVNLGKSKVTAPADAPADYAFSFGVTADVADYVVVNVSSPNTPGLRDLQKTDELARILDPLQAHNAARGKRVPLLVKVAPDLADDDAVAVARLCADRGVDGLIVSNTTIARAGLQGPVPEGPGGVSGRPLFARSTALLRLLKADVGDKLVFVGVGGIFDADDARAKLQAGASLLQAYTGFVYAGPSFARDVLRGLHAPSRGPSSA
ncbi:MAG: quinone-dependent dihydroorotate dehydrogenase [Deltaproteobacteria bacterium]|nr:quinone-dependent dihydroorotate dehydrogenase [Deltaproteobacteria bacterium]